uniref:Uncharacterized protein n=1 Tax=Araneus ventricosus TaxID=182803 RepID=A0A4Y2VP02_ARAVE|nr:hypothetical protein AVEN_96740-1 [Araneus ventricosus]
MNARRSLVCVFLFINNREVTIYIGQKRMLPGSNGNEPLYSSQTSSDLLWGTICWSYWRGIGLHRARFVEDQGSEQMDWPSQSPDLNPTDDLWDYLGRQVNGFCFPFQCSTN